MTIFNNSVPEIDQTIISFTPIEDLITFSGVNKTAYDVLSNNPYFKKLFTEKFPWFKEIGSQLFTEKQSNIKRTGFEKICNKFPNNCWKIFCYVFQTGDVKFNNSSLQELRSKRLEKLTTKKNTLELTLRDVCGNSYEDPSSPIHQAWQAYQENTVDLHRINKSIDSLKDPKKEQFHLSAEQEKLSGTFKEALKLYLETLLSSSSITPEYLAASYSALIIWAAVAYPYKLLQAVEDIYTTDFTATYKEMLEKYKENIFSETIEQYASQPIQEITLENLGAQLRLMQRFYTKLPWEMIRVSLLMAIKEVHGMKFEEALKLQLLTLLSSPQAEPTAAYPVFLIWAAVAHPYNLLQAIQDIHTNYPSATFAGMLEVYNLDILNLAINEYGLRPIQEITLESFQTQVSLMQESYSKLPPEFIRTRLWNVIKRRPGLILELESLQIT